MNCLFTPVAVLKIGLLMFFFVIWEKFYLFFF